MEETVTQIRIGAPATEETRCDTCQRVMPNIREGGIECHHDGTWTPLAPISVQAETEAWRKIGTDLLRRAASGMLEHAFDGPEPFNAFVVQLSDLLLPQVGNEGEPVRRASRFRVSLSDAQMRRVKAAAERLHVPVEAMERFVTEAVWGGVSPDRYLDAVEASGTIPAIWAGNILPTSGLGGVSAAGARSERTG